MNEQRSVVAAKAQEIGPLARDWVRVLGYWLRTPYGMVIAGLALGGVGLAVGWGWLLAVGALPILLSALPCVIMCALGVCMMGKDKSSCAQQPVADEVVSNEPKVTRVDASSTDPALDSSRRRTGD